MSRHTQASNWIFKWRNAVRLPLFIILYYTIFNQLQMFTEQMFHLCTHENMLCYEIKSTDFKYASICIS